ncbi:MAG: hypothetical protein Q9167_001313 [Letrouitia subvulpina]
MPSMPPFSRSEKIEDYAVQCLPVIWREVRTKAADGIDIALAIGEIEATHQPPILEKDHAAATKNRRKHIIVVYFHGNGGSVPPRLPGLSSVLKLLQSSTPNSPRYTFVALSYRGFWTSRGRPSERGISLDASAALRYVNERFASDPDEEPSIVLWGQSIGAGVATSAAAAANSSSSSVPIKDAAVASKSIPIRGLLLETPFTSVKAMLLAIYPQKWLPYRYLHPFLRNHWDSKSALREIANASCRAPNLLILQAGNDELVPSTHSIELESVARELNIKTKRIEVNGALHHEAVMKRRGREETVDFLKGI